jgi:hypothetical protein
MAPVVLRDGVVKAHVVMRDYLAHALISDGEATQGQAVQILVGQLVEVSCVELFDRAVPGAMLTPVENSFDMLRYRHVVNAWSGYFSARISAMLAPKMGEGYRTLLNAALKRASEEIPRLRLDYRFHGDVPRLLTPVLKHVTHVLNHAARLIGHYDGLEGAVLDADATLAAELEKHGLAAWFDHYGRDLRALWTRRGKWSSLEEFLVLCHHVERLLWPFGLFLSQTPDGAVRLDVPLKFDRARLQIEVRKHPLRAFGTIMRNAGRRLLSKARSKALG